MKKGVLFLALSTASLVVSCTDDDPLPLDSVFRSNVQEVVLEVDYQDGAVPYTDVPSLEGNPNPWELFLTNAEALFSEAPRTLTVPMEVEEMELLTDVGEGEDFSVDRIMEIAERHRDDPTSAERRTYYILFVDGYLYNEHEGRLDGVAGVSIGDTGVVAMFKPVASSTSVERFVEQSVLIHEFGHALGLVNNGLSMVEPHHDNEHPAHCINDRCVMYWLNESGRDAAQFVINYVTHHEVLVFGDQCLADAHAAAH